MSETKAKVSVKRDADKITKAPGSTTTKLIKKKNGKKSKLNKADSQATTDSASSTSTVSASSITKLFNPFSLTEIRDKVVALAEKIPTVPEKGIDPQTESKDWAARMQAVVEEFNLLISCVNASTYKWGTDRTGAADQNLTLLSHELDNAQAQISHSVNSKLSNILTPVFELVVGDVTVTKDENGVEKRVNNYVRKENDPEYNKLCGVILSRNAAMMRQVVLTNFHKIARCIEDYAKAAKKDNQNDRNAFAY